ncbi:MAG TPA: hypothetical protein VK988_02960 [Acidimicrobiales bacterium]|nr:hypothetical protein [Acidimicrobiales bacterium]
MRIPLAGNVKQSTVDGALYKALASSRVSRLADLSDEVVEVDLSAATWLDLGALMWLVPVLSRLRSQGNLLRLVLPRRDENSTADNLWSFLQRWRYFDILRMCVDDPVNLLSREQRPYLDQIGKYQRARGVDASGRSTEFHSLGRLEIGILPASTDLGSALESEISTFNEPLATSTLRIICGWSADEVKDFVSVMVPHALRNVTHGRGSFALVGTRLDNRQLHFVVADNGIGIPSLLRTALAQHVSDPSVRDSALIEYFADRDLVESSIREILDSDLVVASTEQAITSHPDPERRYGYGLYYLKRRVLARGGEVRIRSGSAVVTFHRKGVRHEDGLVESPGTTLRLLLPVQRGGGE